MQSSLLVGQPFRWEASTVLPEAIWPSSTDDFIYGGRYSWRQLSSRAPFFSGVNEEIPKTNKKFGEIIHKVTNLFCLLLTLNIVNDKGRYHSRWKTPKRPGLSPSKVPASWPPSPPGCRCCSCP